MLFKTRGAIRVTCNPRSRPDGALRNSLTTQNNLSMQIDRKRAGIKLLRTVRFTLELLNVCPLNAFLVSL